MVYFLSDRSPCSPRTHQDYHWWWRAFLTPAASALYLFVFSVFYFMPKLQITKFVSICLYTGTLVHPPPKPLLVQN